MEYAGVTSSVCDTEYIIVIHNYLFILLSFSSFFSFFKHFCSILPVQ